MHTSAAILLLAWTLGVSLWVDAACVKKTLTLTWERGAPNGQPRDMIFTNGQFPGPDLIFDEDDDAEITVINHMPMNVTVHWHGVEQAGTPWSDGVPGLSQIPISPGDSFVYRFKTSPAGTYWYHSHSRLSLLDGLYGALFIRPKKGAPAAWSMISNDTKDIKAMSRAAAHPELIVVSDWSQYTSQDYWDATEKSKLSLFCVDSILVNGKGAVYCPPHQLLIDQTSAGIQQNALGNATVTDKGCFAFTPGVYEIWLSDGRPDLVPPHLNDGCIPSTGENATIEVDASKQWVSLNFISAATFKTIEFSVDEHDLWIYEIDGNYVQPTLAQTGTMWAGERFSAMVKLDKKPGAYTIRVPDYGGTQIISGFATLQYKNAPSDNGPTEPYVNYGGEVLSNDTKSLTNYLVLTDNVPPFPNVKPAPVADAEHLLLVGRFNASYNYTVTGKKMYPVDANAENPLLYAPNDPFAMDEDLVIRTKNGTWVDLILQVSTLYGDQYAFTHVMHKHGSKTWRIGQALGVWNYSSVAEAMAAEPQSFNLETPNYRDTWLTDFTGGPYWVVLRYQVTNPGPWLFHCHIEVHLAGGMGMAIMDGVDKWPEIPPEYAIGENGYKDLDAPVDDPRGPRRGRTERLY